MKREREEEEGMASTPQNGCGGSDRASGKGDHIAELLRRARKEISIEELEIPHLEIKRARTGRYILGVPGQHPEEKADRLAARLVGLASDMGVRVTRPTKKADIRVSGLEEYTTPEEVVAAVAKMTDCRAGDIRSGQVQGFPTGVGPCGFNTRWKWH